MGASDKESEQVAIINLNLVVKTAEGLVISFGKQERQTRIARSLLIGFIVAALILTIVFAVLVTNYFSPFLNSHAFINGILFVGIAVTSLVVAAAASYLMLNKRKNQQLLELSSLILQIKSNSDTQVTTQNGLVLTDRILAILPNIVRKRSEDPILFGILGAIVVLVLSRISLLAAPIGIAIWFYFWHSTNRSFKRALERIEDQKKAFERYKEQYIESL
ncbi:MAG: hypothetical protein ACRDF4_03505 [Rhabdochlamydiaceae bacterium]